jgi:hypothetical protein
METNESKTPKIKDPNKLEEPVLPTKQIAGILAQMTHDPNCKLCHGKGYLGYRLADTQILFCRCAYFKTDGFVYVMQHVQGIEKGTSHIVDMLHAELNELQRLNLELQIQRESTLMFRIKKLFRRSNGKVPINGTVSSEKMEPVNASQNN